MERYTVNSKYFVPMTSQQMLKRKILLIALAVYAILVLILCITEGVNWHKILVLLLGYVIAKNFLARTNTGYQFAILDIEPSTEQISLEYSNVQYGKDVISINVHIENDSITELEFSDKLNALRVVGDVKKNIPSKAESEDLNDWVMYIDGDASEIIKAIESNTDRQVVFVDRKEQSN